MFALRLLACVGVLALLIQRPEVFGRHSRLLDPGVSRIVLASIAVLLAVSYLLKARPKRSRR